MFVYVLYKAGGILQNDIKALHRGVLCISLRESFMIFVEILIHFAILLGAFIAAYDSSYVFSFRKMVFIKK